MSKDFNNHNRRNQLRNRQTPNRTPPQPEFSLSNLEPFLPDPFVEEASGKTLDEIVLEEFCFDYIKSKTLTVLEDPPGGNDELWDLLRELVLITDIDGSPRFMP